MAEVPEKESKLPSAARASFTALTTVARKARPIEPFRADDDVCGVAIGIGAEGLVPEDWEDSEKRPADMLLFFWRVVIVKNAEELSKAIAAC